MSCDACRIYHYKCDDEVPTCRRCARAGRECVRPTQYRFRNSHADSLPFPKFQVWLDLPQRVDFVDETPALEDEYAGPTTRLRRQSTRLPIPPNESDLECTPAENFDKWVRSQSAAENPPRTPMTPGIAVDSPWPVRTAQDARLIAHFVEKVAHYFDFCDPNRHFALVVPQRARKNSTLAYAVLALSARHLSRTEDFDPLVADYHYQKCCEQLIPALADNAAVTNDCLLAATVILRFLEEIDVPITGEDQENHLVGTQAIVRAQGQQYDQVKMPSDLRESAKWAAFRQDLYMALTKHRPMQLNRIIQPFVDMDEGDWANRAVLLCGDALQFAFRELPNRIDAYQLLKHVNEDWRRERPTSFDPIFSETSDPTRFPIINFLADWHVMGHMYNYLAHLLLVVYDPTIPRMGLSYTEANERANDEAKYTVRVMAGIAISNPRSPAAMLVAAMAIAMCGDRFHTPTEQVALFRILKETEEIHGWPTDLAQRRLRKAWQCDWGLKSA
ncbi:hypothetical protein EV356DRAFT_579518 [Viridothelium virens]|uniref:Zn(2)-C6 fungal-type domain-containing protein n=1 Tax=Viridothelium virens TaxID=1048519 RepID=A0A6A6GYY1_VIRVR|nr:hypothetical protein EV356DRAFT_579518 [Viridothelium virens]